MIPPVIPGLVPYRMHTSRQWLTVGNDAAVYGGIGGDGRRYRLEVFYHGGRTRTTKGHGVVATRSAWHAVQELRGPPWFFLISVLNQRSIGKSATVPAGSRIDEAGLAKTVRRSTEANVNDNVAVSLDRKPWKNVRIR